MPNPPKRTSALSPFRWTEFPQPSVFAGDPAFAANKHGKSASETAVASTTAGKRKAIDGLSEVKSKRTRSPGHNTKRASK
jgi:hypothetical protein